jgi:hypothetical protein
MLQTRNEKLSGYRQMMHEAIDGDMKAGVQIMQERILKLLEEGRDEAGRVAR